MPKRLILTSALAVALISPAFCADDAADFPPQPPIQPKTAQEEAKTFHLPPGYHLELVLSDPEIKEPVALSFDGNGRMYVVEMRSYMQDIDGNNEITPVGRVSRHWSSKGDGVYDQHSVFADKLTLPRMVLPLEDGKVVIGETNTLDLNLFTDTKGSGVYDKKDLWYAGGPRGGNLEHQPSGLVWALDNWIYTTYNAYRLRWTPKEILKEPTGNNNGQWGLGQDNHGKLYFNNAGGERGPQSFEVPVVYGGFNPRSQFAAGFEEVFPLPPGMADEQGGPNRFRPDEKTLNHFTATAGVEIFRGDRLPEEVRGDLFFGEPVGRLLRRAHVDEKDGFITLSNPYQAERSEFLRSSDQLFRPINVATAPDGTLYIVDMYRGIIQEGNWVKEGSYLRKVVKQYSFDKVTSHGRIWRLVHDGFKPGPQPAMYQETPAQLVAHLEHPNGWWRDTAQRLLILKQDRSVVPALTEMARSNPNYLARLHALWTLEGLDALDPALVREKLKDAHPQLRVAAIRVSETLYKKGDKSLQSAVEAMTKDKASEVVLQAMLTEQLLNFPDAKQTLTRLVATSKSTGVHEIGDLILHPPAPPADTKKFTAEEKKIFNEGQGIFNSLCATCHGPDGRGLPMVGGAPGTRLAPSLSGAPTINGRKEGPIYVLLNGLNGDIDGHKYEGQMISMATNDDKWIAAVVSFVRNNFGNHAGFVTAKDVTAMRAATAGRTQPWTDAELKAAMPQPLANRAAWKLSARDNAANAALAVDGKPETRWDTHAKQQPGQWFQIELPEPTLINGLQLDNTKSGGDFPRGYEVAFSDDGTKWSKPVATGKGGGPVTNIDLPETKTKFIKITQTGKVDGGTYWSIHELQIYAPTPVKPSVAAASPAPATAVPPPSAPAPVAAKP